MTPAPFPIRQLGAEDVSLIYEMLAMFGDAFDDADTYNGRRPSPQYLQSLLASESFIALVALDGDVIVGGIAAYELRKFEQERSEIYIYDLAVVASHRRKGIATALIQHLQSIAASRGAYVIFVQADTTEDDQPAIALYTRLGHREDVLHFDIKVEPNQADTGS
jgi:aminoglycoside 3-N-acetyltransferase I